MIESVLHVIQYCFAILFGFSEKELNYISKLSIKLHDYNKSYSSINMWNIEVIKLKTWSIVLSY